MSMDWDDYRHYAAIVHAGSVRAAAGRLGVNPSTVTRRLEHLEQRLGVQLFSRTPHGLVSTRHGREIADRIDRIAREIGAIEADLRAGEAAAAGLVRLMLPKSLYIVLLARLEQFMALQPLIEIEIVNPLQSAATDTADIIIRGTPDPDDDLIARPLGRPCVGIHVRADLHQEMINGKPEHALGWLSLLDPDLGTGIDEELRGDGFSHLPVKLRTTSVLQQLAALRAGLGVGMLPRWMAGDSSGLVEIPTMSPHVAQPFWLLSRPELRRVLRVQLLLDWLRGELVDPVYGFVRSATS